MSTFRTLVTDPDSFFRDRTESASLRWPAAIVTAVALVGAASAAVELGPTLELTSRMFNESQMDTIGPVFQVIQIASLAFGIVFSYVLWVIYAAVFYGISVVFDGDGDFSTTLAVVGWGFLPNVFSSLASLAITHYRYNVVGIDLPANVTAESMQEVTRQLSTGPLLALSAAIGIVFTLWAAVLWTYGMKHARTLSLRNAALTVALPVVVSILFPLRTVLTTIL